MRTPIPARDGIARKWYVVDADGQVLGRLATRVASLLIGKHKPHYTPHLDVGDHVVVINAARVHLTGQKPTSKMYRTHSGYIGGLREVRAGTMLRTHPERVIEWAVGGMLPKTRLGRAMARKLKVYAGSEHPHASQRPEPLDLSRPATRAAGATKGS
jgi:large subunit ribosomal protein L13